VGRTPHTAAFSPNMGVPDCSRRASLFTCRPLSSVVAASTPQHTTPAPTDRIVMRGLQFFGKHGVLPEVRRVRAAA
jgi:hypothetical protein